MLSLYVFTSAPKHLYMKSRFDGASALGESLDIRRRCALQGGLHMPLQAPTEVQATEQRTRAAAQREQHRRVRAAAQRRTMRAQNREWACKRSLKWMDHEMTRAREDAADLFDIIDVNGDGDISVDEMFELLRSLGLRTRKSDVRAIFAAVDERRDRDNGILDSLDRTGFARLMTDPKVSGRLNSMIKMQQMLPVPLLKAAILRKQRISGTAGPCISTWKREEQVRERGTAWRKGSARSVTSVSSVACKEKDQCLATPFLGQNELDQLAASSLRDLRSRRGFLMGAGQGAEPRGGQGRGRSSTAAAQHRRDGIHARYGKAWSKQLSRIASLWQSSDPKVQAAYLEKFMGLDKAGEPPPYSAVAGTDDVMDKAVGQVRVQNQQFASPFC